MVSWCGQFTTPQYICPTFAGGVRLLSWGGGRTPQPPWQIQHCIQYNVKASALFFRQHGKLCDFSISVRVRTRVCVSSQITQKVVDRSPWVINTYKVLPATGERIQTRRLAIANRAGVSIRVTKLARAGGVVVPVKVFLSSSLITVQHLVAACHTVWVWAHVGGSKQIWVMEPHSLGIGIVPDPVETVNTLLPYVEVGRCRYYRMGIGSGSKKIEGIGAPPPWVGGVADPWNTPFPTCYLADFGHSRSNVTSAVTDIRWKNLTPRVPGISRPLKVIGTDTDRSATYDFLLMIHSRRGPVNGPVS